MADVDRLKKQLRDLTDLYESEKERANNAQQTLADFWRREPLVHLMWSEIILLRKLLETHYKQAPAILDLPQQRAGERSKGNPLSFRDRLVSTALKVFNEKGTSVDDFLNGNFTTGSGMTQSPTQTLKQQTDQRQQPLGASNDVVSQQIQQQQQRIQQLEQQLQQYHGEIQRLSSQTAAQQNFAMAPMDSNNNIPPPPMDGGIPPPPMDGEIPPPPQDGGVPAAPVAVPAAAPGAGNIPQPPVLPGFVGKAGAAPPGGAAGAAGGAGTVPGTTTPMPPVLPGFTAKYPGQGGSVGASTAGAASAVAAAPPPDPGPQPTKAAVKPTKKMKALHWKPIITGDKAKQTQAAKDSIWAQIDRVYPTATRDISVIDFEERFTSAPPKAKAGKENDPESQAKALAEANKPQRLLDPNRHNQLSIMLSKMPSLPEMKRALIELDSTKLKPEHIESLHKNMFTAEDVELVKSAGIPKDRLMLPEQWILEMSTIPQLAARIECWRFSQVFQEDYIAVVRPLARLETTCNEIRTSASLRQWFTYVLVIGNHLNGGTARGRADGFDLDSLSKLFRIKDSEGSGTLIDYLVAFMIQKFGPDCTSSLRSELATLSESKGSSLRQIAGDAKKLLGKINLTLKMQSLVIAQNIPGDKFEQVLGSFAADAEQKVKSLDSRATSALSSFFEVVQYLEPHLDKGQVDKTQSEEWFPLLDEFVAGIVRSHRESIRKAEQAEKEAKQAANMAAMRAKAGGNPNAPQPAAGAGELTEGGFPKLRTVQRDDNGASAPNPMNELSAGFPKLRSAQDPNPAQRPVEQNQSFTKPQLRSAQTNQGGSGAPAQQEPGFVKPQLRSAQTNQNSAPAPAPAQPQGDTPFVRPQLKKTETKTAETKVQMVSASEFDDVKRPSAKSNVFLKAQSKAPMGQTVKQQEQKMQQLQVPEEAPPPAPHFVDDSGSGSDDDGLFFRGLDLPPPPPDSDSD